MKTNEEEIVKLDEVSKRIETMLEDIHNNMLLKAFENRKDRTFIAQNMEEMKLVFENKQGFVKTMWCGDRKCEDKMKEEVGVTIRCMPLEQEDLGNKCICCGKEAKNMVYIGKQY